MNRSLAIAAHCDAAESAGDRGFRAESVQGPWAGPSWSIQGRHWPEGVCTRPVPARPSHKASALWGKPGRVSLYKAGTSPAESGPARSFRLGGARRFAVDRYAAHGAHPGRGRPRPAPVQPRRYRADSGRAEPIQARCRPSRLGVRQYNAGTGPSESVQGLHCETVQS